jgi:hypothetical protein
VTESNSSIQFDVPSGGIQLCRHNPDVGQYDFTGTVIIVGQIIIDWKRQKTPAKPAPTHHVTQTFDV